MEDLKLTCEVCGEPTDLYYCSRIAPATYAYCKDCSEAGAEPYYPLLGKVVLSGGIKNCTKEIIDIIKISLERIRKVHPHLTFLTYDLFLEHVEEEIEK